MHKKMELIEKVIQKHHANHEIIQVGLHDAIEVEHQSLGGCSWEQTKDPDDIIRWHCKPTTCKSECVTFTVTVKDKGKTKIVVWCVCNDSKL